MLSGLGRVQESLAGQSDPPLFLMGLDTNGDGHAIIASGNPDTAANVATYVPGTGSDLAGIGGGIERSGKMLAAATAYGSPPTAVITWFGYDAPPSLPDAVSDSYAQHAAGALDTFQLGLRATHPGSPSHNTVVGHSYGTTVIGAAATHGRTLNADDVILVASPGAETDHATGLHLGGVPDGQQGHHVYATYAQYDPVQLSNPVHGVNPTEPAFGGTTFTSAPDGPGPWYELGWNPGAHSDYWNSNTPSLTNMGLIIAGHGSEVT